jgi:hypothetical protein
VHHRSHFCISHRYFPFPHTTMQGLRRSGEIE